MEHNTEHVNISMISAGDTIMFNGEMKTVCQKDIHTGGFMGTSIFGDSYRAGTKKVERFKSDNFGRIQF